MIQYIWTKFIKRYDKVKLLKIYKYFFYSFFLNTLNWKESNTFFSKSQPFGIISIYRYMYLINYKSKNCIDFYMSVYRSVCLSISPFVYYVSIYLYIRVYLSIYLSILISIYLLSIYLSTHASLSIYLFVYL